MAWKEPSWENTKTRHGTPSGARLHSILGERPCDPCYNAKSAYDQRWRSASPRQQTSRSNARAQYLATHEIIHKYWKEYKEAYARALEQVQLEIEETEAGDG